MPDENDNAIQIPKVFINKNIFRNFLKQPKRCYSINGELFYDNKANDVSLINDNLTSDLITNDEFIFDLSITNNYKNFEVYAKKGDATNFGIEDEDDGYIWKINDNIFLTSDQIQTLVPVDDELLFCFICDQIYPKLEAESHTSSEAHTENLKIYRPLRSKSSTGEVTGYYHCGICTIMLDSKNNFDKHNKSSTHIDKLVNIKKKSSDCVNNDDTILCSNSKNNVAKHNKSSTYTEKLINVENRSSDYVNNNDTNICLNNNYENKNEHNTMETNSDAQFVHDNHRDINILFEDNTNTDYIVEISIDEPSPSTISYASIASNKPKRDNTEFLEKQHGNRFFLIHIDSYNMCLKMTDLTYFCFVCRNNFFAKDKLKHYDDIDHRRIIDSSLIIEDFDHLYVRYVTDKFYHCGHCNEITCSSSYHHIVSHFKLKHNFKNSQINSDSKNSNRNYTPVLNTAKENPNKVDRDTETVTNFGIADENGSINTTIYETTNEENDKNDFPATKTKVRINETDRSKTSIVIDKNNAANKLCAENAFTLNENSSDKLKQEIVNQTDSRQNNDSNSLINNVELDANTSIDTLSLLEVSVICCGKVMTVPLLAYNVTCQNGSTYYCALCIKILQNEYEAKIHFYDLIHLELLENNNFLDLFSCHLIRNIRGTYHCTLCNMPIDMLHVNNHIVQPSHCSSLADAMNGPKNRLRHTSVPSLVAPISVINGPLAPMQMPQRTPIYNQGVAISAGRFPSQGAPIPFYGQSFPCYSRPIPSQVMSITSQGLLIPPPGLLMPPQGIPIPSQGMPIPSQRMPIPSQGIPIPSQGIPITSQGMPIPSQSMPIPSQGMPIPSQGMPIPSQGMPVPSQGMPIPCQGMPIPSQGMPIPSQGIPIQPQRTPIFLEESQISQQGIQILPQNVHLKSHAIPTSVPNVHINVKPSNPKAKSETPSKDESASDSESSE